MTPLRADSTVERNDLTVVGNIADRYAACVTNAALGDTADSGEYHTCRNLMFCRKVPDAFQQIVSAVQTFANRLHIVSSEKKVFITLKGTATQPLYFEFTMT